MFLKDFFLKKLILKTKLADDKKHVKLPSMQIVESVPVDCSELDGNPTRDGVYTIYPAGDPGSSTLAFCLFDSGEAWTVRKKTRFM